MAFLHPLELCRRRLQEVDRWLWFLTTRFEHADSFPFLFFVLLLCHGSAKMSAQGSCTAVARAPGQRSQGSSSHLRTRL